MMDAVGIACDLIKRWEGCALHAYPDPGSGGEPWTIGYGHTGGVKQGDVWTQFQADSALKKDVSAIARAIKKMVDGKYTGHQLGAMISLAYNIGLDAFKKSTLLKKHNAGDYTGAAREFAKFRLASGHVMTGLVRRRADESVVYGCSG